MSVQTIFAKSDVYDQKRTKRTHDETTLIETILTGEVPHSVSRGLSMF